ncbi:sensor histidine kinase [Hyphomicrobium sp.]|uniref:sensor histidine kinase n=1 Tax=Hyphomicrobium sp. TaxID=82 RepID=UPI003F717ACF
MSIFSSGFARKTLGLMAAATFILIMIALLSLWMVARTQDSASSVANDRQVRIAAGTILTALLNAETAQRGFLLTGDEAYLGPLTGAESDLPRYFTALREAAQRARDTSAEIDQLEQLASMKMRELTRTVELQRAGRHDDALTIVNTGEGRTAMDDARKVLGQIIASAESEVGDNLGAMERDAKQLAWVTGLGGLSIVLFSLAAFYIVKQNTAGLVAARQTVLELNTGLEDRVAERTTSLTRANDEIQRFAYIVSHDLRAPLVNIMGFTSELEVGTAALKTYFAAAEPNEDQILSARRAAEEEIPEAVHFIRTSTHKMDGLIGAILKLSREGRRELKRERVDLDALVRGGGANLQHQLDTADAAIDIPKELPSVVGDRLALEQVFGNILENAVKYLAKDRPGLIEVEGEESGGRVKIRIKDNGRGIEEKDLERVFELFRRAGPQDRPGEGVGLAHVRALVRRMGGDVTVASRFGHGTTFEVDLPKKSRTKDTYAESL